jgi:hypothetical protein
VRTAPPHTESSTDPDNVGLSELISLVGYLGISRVTRLDTWLRMDDAEHLATAPE